MGAAAPEIHLPEAVPTGPQPLQAGTQAAQKTPLSPGLTNTIGKRYSNQKALRNFPQGVS